MQKIKLLLLYGLFCSVFLGELARIPIINGIAVSLLDIFCFFIFLVVFKEQIATKKIIRLPFFKPVLAFLGIGTLSLILNAYWLSPIEIFTSFLYAIRFALLAGVYFFVSSLKPEIKNKIPYLMVFVAVAIVLVGFVQYFYIDFTSLSFLDWDIHWYRLFSTFIDPNFMGVFLIVSFFVALMLLTKVVFKKNKKQYTFLAISAILLLSGVLLTFSRTALISIIFGLAVFGFNFKKSKKIVIAAAICLIIGIGIILLNYQATEGTKLFRLTSSEARISSIKSALTVIKNNPLFGIGFDAYRYAMHKYGFAISTNWQYSHSDAGTDNSFLFVFATTGLLGLACFLFLLYVIIKNILKGIKTNSMNVVALSSMATIGLSSFFINAFFYPLILTWLWVIIGITDLS